MKEKRPTSFTADTRASAVYERFCDEYGSRIARSGAAGPIALLIIIAVYMAFASPVFLTATNWDSIASQSVFLVIIAIGMTVVLVSGGIDLSVGSTMAVSAAVAGKLILGGQPMAVAFAAALALGIGIGVLNGLLITKLGIPDFVATLAMLGVLRGLLLVWTQANPIYNYTNDLYFKIGGIDDLTQYVRIPELVALAVALLVGGMLAWTAMGRHIYAVGGNREAAILSGINAVRVTIGVYALSGFLAAVSGVMFAGWLGEVQPGQAGVGFELAAIAAAVVGGAALTGGRGSIVGAIAGALVIVTIRNALNLKNVDPNWSDVVVGALIIGAVGIQRLGQLYELRPRRQRQRMAAVEP